MEKLCVELEHCYGIKSLNYTFDFKKARAVAIYAPNGMMKSSFARTFQDAASNKASKDNIFPTRQTKRSIQVDGAEIQPESILIIQPYDDVFSHGERTSTLLINAHLRKEYEQIHQSTEDAKQRLLSELSKVCGTKASIEKEISLTFTTSERNFFRALLRVQEEVPVQEDYLPADFPYDQFFDEKVKALFESQDVQKLLKDYIERQNELLEKSTYFKKGIFNYYNAGTVAKALADNGFFNANHGLVMNVDDPTEIKDVSELEALISKEKDSISSDPALKKKLLAIEKAITKNANVRGFEAYLSSHEDILAHLANYESFKEEVWKIYLRRTNSHYVEVCELYRAAEKRRKEIEDLAAKERTDWEEVIDIFNSRFFVPFTLSVKNRVEVALGKEPVAALGFTFSEGQDAAQIERTELLQALSTGEKKALYILNLIFEIRARKKLGINTIIVVDDIADSFDYRNKYAIIQYLKDISEDDVFRQVILTHNFDFFRSINSRFVGYANCFMVIKTPTGIQVEQATGVSNIFINDWKKKFFTSEPKKLACIPFMRNLLEYTKGESDADYVLLTSLLHIKPDTDTITVGQLSDIFQRLFGHTSQTNNPQECVVDVLSRCATACLAAGIGHNFENKVVLSIAIRLAVERYMLSRVSDKQKLWAVSSKQTSAWFDLFRQEFPADPAIKVIDRVLLMTPENIHLNAFMYEPLLDMSDEHLRRLHTEVSQLI